MVGATGFEPVTSRVQTEHSDQTELHPDKKDAWWGQQDLNLRPNAYQAFALPTELHPRIATGGKTRTRT